MFVAIVKTMKDEVRDDVSKNLPDSYPVECAEFTTQEEALAKHPGALIMSLESYLGYKQAFQTIYEEALRESPSFWSKLNPF